MAEQNLSLSLAFIKSHPEAAARVLERLDLEAAAGFISTLPRASADQLTRRMLPRYLGRLCDHLDSKAVVTLLSEKEPSFIAAVLRQLAPAARESVLSGLSADRRTACNLLLSFSSDTVGAWQTPHAAVVPDDYSVDEALHHVKVTGQGVYTEYVFVVDRDRMLRGRIRNLDLLWAQPSDRITAIMDTDLVSLPARLSLQRAAEHAAWASVDVMPVNNRRSQFIGIIRHVDLRKGLEQLGSSASTETEHEVLGDFIGLYSDSILALFNSLGEVIESTVSTSHPEGKS